MRIAHDTEDRSDATENQGMLYKFCKSKSGWRRTDNHCSAPRGAASDVIRRRSRSVCWNGSVHITPWTFDVVDDILLNKLPNHSVQVKSTAILLLSFPALWVFGTIDFFLAQCHLNQAHQALQAPYDPYWRCVASALKALCVTKRGSIINSVIMFSLKCMSKSVISKRADAVMLRRRRHH